MGTYDWATICLNGHVVSASEYNYIKFCKICGESTTSECPSCSTAIHGKYNIEGIFDFTDYQQPLYCHECGMAYPWTLRVIESAIELLHLDEDLSRKYKEIIKSAIPDLIVDRPTTPIATAKYRRYMSKGSAVVKEGMRNILVDVVSETVKK